MSWTLGALTLKRPSKYEPLFKEVSTTHEMIDGTHKKDITRQYRVHELTFSALTIAEWSSLNAQYELLTALAFAVSDGSFSISSRNVLMEIKNRKFMRRGSEFRADVVIQLLEV